MLQPKRLYDRTGRTDEYKRTVQRLKQERIAEFDKYPGLEPGILAAIR